MSERTLQDVTLNKKLLFFCLCNHIKNHLMIQMQKHRTNRIRLQNSSESSLTDKFKRNWIAFTYMSSASEGGPLLIYCSGSFSFPRACRKKKTRECEIHRTPVENKPHKNIVTGSLCKVSRLQTGLRVKRLFLTRLLLAQMTIRSNNLWWKTGLHLCSLRCHFWDTYTVHLLKQLDLSVGYSTSPTSIVSFLDPHLQLLHHLL